MFYDGFVPYLMTDGARGVVGTPCATGPLFAVQVAKRSFERLLGGEALLEAFLDLRREFLDEYGNPLGPINAVKCNGDTHNQPALKV